jgi:hypothetical protein
MNANSSNQPAIAKAVSQGNPDLSLETKIEIVRRNARRSGQSEAMIALQRLEMAYSAYLEARRNIHSNFNLECWNSFSKEFTPSEISAMAKPILEELE